VMPSLSGPTVFALVMLLSTSTTMKFDLSLFVMRWIDVCVKFDACYVVCFWCACMGRRFLFSTSRSITHKLRALDHDGQFSGVFRQDNANLILSSLVATSASKFSCFLFISCVVLCRKHRCCC
jgi:hypothetical protein